MSSVPAAATPPPLLDTLRRVATPEGIEITLPVAGPIPRCLAWTIDLLLRLGVIWILAIAVSALGRTGSGILLIAWFAMEWLFPALCETYWKGATPGKRAMGLVVLHDDGTPVRWSAAIIRNLLRAVDFLPLLYGFGFLCIMLNRDFKRLGDLAAGTVVVHRPRLAAAAALPAVAPFAPPLALSVAEQRVVLDFAERAAALTEERGAELAELVPPLVGNRHGAAARERLLAIANFLAGRGA